MTETQYAATVTEIINELAGPDFEFPATAEADIHACFLRRTLPSAAADKLLAEWSAADTGYVVRDASGEYLRADGRRTPASNEAAEYETREEAEAARERATDRVIATEAN